MLTLITLLGVAGCAPGERRDAVDFERMRQQQRYDPYEASGIFADGKVVQTPPAGTVEWSAPTALPLATGLSGTTPLPNVPVPMATAALERGRERFGIFCAPCHGSAGFGGSLIASSLDPPRPPPLRGPSARTLPAGALYQIIVRGGPRMPPFAGALSPAERWAVVAYVGSLQMPHPLTPGERADSARADTLARRHSSSTLSPP